MEELTPLRSSSENTDNLRLPIPRKPIASIPRKPVPTYNHGNLGSTSTQSVHRTASFQPLDPGSRKSDRRKVLDGNFLNHITRSFNYPWLVEVLSCLLSCVSFVAIIVTLAVHQGRPLPQWPRLISINSLIAIFTAVLKASLLMPVAEGLSQLKWQHFGEPHYVIDLDRYDSASRGPWGSLLLMFKTRKHFLTFLGAFITLAALAIDPFTQQVLLYYDCLQTIPGSIARIPRTNNYNQSGVHVWAGENTLDSKMTAAVYLGLYNPPDNASSIMPFECLTGNCTFPADNGATLSSVAMCFAYRDINDTIITPNSSNEYWGALPSGANISQATTLNTVQVYGEPGDLMTFDTIMVQDFNCVDDDPYNCSGRRMYGFRSALFPCLKTYAANISRFVLEEHEILSIPLPYLKEGGDWILQTNQTLRNGLWQNCISSPIQTSQNPVPFPFSSITDLPSNMTIQYYPADCVWSFQHRAGEAFSTNIGLLFLNQNLSSTLSTPTNAQGPDYLVNLAHNGTANRTTVERYLKGLADSITANIRQRGETLSDDYALGIVQDSQTCISVQWAWLSLPAALLLFAIIFLVSVVVQTLPSQPGRPPLWKSSAIALLFHDFGDDGHYSSQGRYGNLDSKEDMTSFARTMKASLVKGGVNGWNFVEKGHEWR